MNTPIRDPNTNASVYPEENADLATGESETVTTGPAVIPSVTTGPAIISSVTTGPAVSDGVTPHPKEHEVVEGPVSPEAASLRRIAVILRLPQSRPVSDLEEHATRIMQLVISLGGKPSDLI